MARKILLITAIILVVLSAGLFYVNKVLLPVQAKAIIIKAAEEQLGRKVELDGLYFHPVKGIVLTGITVAEKDRPGETFLSIREASAQVLLPALLRKKIVLTSVRVHAPALQLTRLEPRVWNFSDLIKPAASNGNKSPQPFSFIVSGISITDGQVKLVDLSQGVVFKETISPVDIRGSLSSGAEIRVSGTIGLPATQGSLKVSGRHALRSGNFQYEVTAHNASLARYLRLLPTPPLAVRALTIADTDLTIAQTDGALSISGNGAFPALDIDPAAGISLKTALTLNNLALTSIKGGAIVLQGGANATGLVATWGVGQSLHGNVKMSIVKLTVGKTITGLTGNLEGKNLYLKLSDDLSVSGDLVLPAISIKPSAKGLTATSDLNLSRAVVSLANGQTLSGDIMASRTTFNIHGKDILGKADLTIRKLKADLPAVAAESDIAAPSSTFSFKDGKAEFNARLALKNLHAVVDKTMTFSGHPAVTIHFKNDPGYAPALSYAGSLKPKGITLSGLPTVDAIYGLNGRITFTTDKAQTKGLVFTAWDAPVRMSGEISSFASPKIGLDISADTVDLALIQKILPDLVKAQGLTMVGTAAVSARIVGKAADLAHAMIRAKAEVKDGSLASTKLQQKIEKINGLLTYETPTLFWKDLSGICQGKTYVLNGYLQDPVNPFISGSIRAENLQADYQIKKKGATVAIEKVSGSYFDSTFDIDGSVRLTDGAEPRYDLSGDVKLSLRDLPRLLPPEQAQKVEPLQLTGDLKVKAQIKGQGTDWAHWDSRITAVSPSVSVQGYQIDNLVASATQKDGSVKPLAIDGEFYGGTFRIFSEIDLVAKGFPFETTFKTERTDLALLKRATPLKDKQLAGLLAVTGGLKGRATDIRDMTGKSTFSITEGHLLEMEILSKILSIVSTTFQGGDIVITDAAATLVFDKGRVMTNDLTLKSQTVTLLAQGWLDWDQNIEFNVTPRLEPQAGPGGTINPLSVLNPTEGLVNIRVYNTLRQPKFEHNLSAPTIIKKTLQNTVGNILKIFE